METPKDDEEIDIVELTERIQKAHPEISFETILMVLSSTAFTVDDKTKAIILSFAGKQENSKDKHRTNGE